MTPERIMEFWECIRCCDLNCPNDPGDKAVECLEAVAEIEDILIEKLGVKPKKPVKYQGGKLVQEWPG